MYGEWLYARHTIPYDQLPHYFLEFDILDRETGMFLSTDRRHALLAGSPVRSVPVLARSPAPEWGELLTRSTCSSGELMEGLYVVGSLEGLSWGATIYAPGVPAGSGGFGNALDGSPD